VWGCMLGWQCIAQTKKNRWAWYAQRFL